MKFDPIRKGFGVAAVAALMLGSSSAALFAATPADTLVIA